MSTHNNTPILLLEAQLGAACVELYRHNRSNIMRDPAVVQCMIANIEDLCESILSRIEDQEPIDAYVDQDLDPSPVDPVRMSRLKQILYGLKPANNQEQISPDLINIDFKDPLK